MPDRVASVRDKRLDAWEGLKWGLLLSGFIWVGYVMGGIAAWDACRTALAP